MTRHPLDLGVAILAIVVAFAIIIAFVVFAVVLSDLSDANVPNDEFAPGPLTPKLIRRGSASSRNES